MDYEEYRRTIRTRSRKYKSDAKGQEIGGECTNCPDCNPLTCTLIGGNNYVRKRTEDVGRIRTSDR